MPWNSLGSRRVAETDGTGNTSTNEVLGSKEDVGSLAANVSSLVAIARKGAKEAWEAEHHVHSGERWFGLAATSDATHKADRVGAGAAGAEAAPIVMDAGNDDWSVWGQFLGSADTPTDGGSATHFDLHKIEFSAYEDTAQRYMIQIALQAVPPADDPVASDIYTEFEVVSGGVGANSSIPPIRIQGNRVPVGTNAWGRVRAPNQDTSTISGYFGIHEYTDPDV